MTGGMVGVVAHSIIVTDSVQKFGTLDSGLQASDLGLRLVNWINFIKWITLFDSIHVH